MDDPSGDPEQPVPGTELEQEELDQLVCARHDGYRTAADGVAADSAPSTTSSDTAGGDARSAQAGGAPPAQLAEAELFHCEKCVEPVPPLRLHPVMAPARDTLNHEVVIDVRETKDAASERIPSSRSCATELFQTIVMVRQGGGTPSSRKFAAQFSASWVACASCPVCFTCHRGEQNRGFFTQTLSAYGVYLRTASVKAAKQIGRCELHGGTVRKNLFTVVAACVSAKNALFRQGGIAPCQGELGPVPWSTDGPTYV